MKRTSASTPRRPRKSALAAERLEGRELMTGGVGSTFAIIPATINKAGGQAAVSFNLNPGYFTDKGNHSFQIGLDVAPNSSSTANPEIVSVVSPTGKTLSVTHTTFDPKVTRSGVQASSTQTTAVLVTIPGLPAKGAKDTYKVIVSGADKSSGGVLVGFYLPGDADGNGIVQQADLNAIRYAMNTTANDSTGKYSFDADANRDGEITQADLKIAQKDLGVGTTVSPVISANVTPSQMVDPTNRITNLSTIAVTGTATPNSTITYSETGEPSVTVGADASGNYSVNIPLLTGSNTYNVTTTDAFGQTITGSINSITYNPAATPPEVTATTTGTTTTTSTTNMPASTSTSTSTTATATTPTTTAATTTPSTATANSPNMPVTNPTTT